MGEGISNAFSIRKVHKAAQANVNLISKSCWIVTRIMHIVKGSTRLPFCLRFNTGCFWKLSEPGLLIFMTAIQTFERGFKLLSKLNV
jgi:hypothetical protein